MTTHFRMIGLSKIVRDAPEAPAISNSFTDTDEPGENPGAGAPEAPRADTTPVVINVACIRCFYPRIENRQGTRLTFNDGGGFAVAESFAEVSQLVGPVEAVGESAI